MADSSAWAWQGAQTEVVGDRQVLAEGQLLVDDPDARPQRVPRTGEPDRPAVELDLAGVGGVDPGQ